MEKWKIVRNRRKSIAAKATQNVDYDIVRGETSDNGDNGETYVEEEESKIEEIEDEEEFQKLMDLHILIMPRELWLGRYQTAVNTALHESTSAGFVRTHPFSSLFEIRNAIALQLGNETVPDYYIFLHNVGRCLVAVNKNQETKLTAADFARFPHFEILLLPCPLNNDLPSVDDEIYASRRTEIEILRNQLDNIRMESEVLQRSREILRERRKDLTSQVQSKRASDQEAWKQKYFTEKSKTEHLEEELRELSKSFDSMTKAIAKKRKEEKEQTQELPSKKNNLRNTVTRLEKEVAEVKTRYESILQKVEKETSTKKMVEMELREMMRVKTQRAVKSI